MLDADALNQLVHKYKEIGEYRFYRFLMLQALNALVSLEKDTLVGAPPNLEFLNYYDRFIILYRREGDPAQLEVARIFRKIAHKVYRIMLKKDMIPAPDKKFLNLV